MTPTSLSSSYKYMGSTHDQMSEPDIRIMSVWKSITWQAKRFYCRTPKMHRTILGVDDYLQEIYCELRDVDSKWDKSRSSYATFCGTVVGHLLPRIANRALPVQVGINYRHTLKKKLEYLRDFVPASETDYAKYRNAMALVAAMEFADRSTREVESSTLYACDSRSLDESIDETSRIESLFDAIGEAIAYLTPTQAFIVSQTYGLYGSETLRPKEIAISLGRTVRWVVDQRKDGLDLLGLHLSMDERVGLAS